MLKGNRERSRCQNKNLELNICGQGRVSVVPVFKHRTIQRHFRTLSSARQSKSYPADGTAFVYELK